MCCSVRVLAYDLNTLASVLCVVHDTVLVIMSALFCRIYIF
jgi:hypothetical protein